MHIYFSSLRKQDCFWMTISSFKGGTKCFMENVPQAFFAASSWHNMWPLQHGRIKCLYCQPHPKSHACEVSPQWHLRLLIKTQFSQCSLLYVWGKREHIFWPSHILAFIRKSVLPPSTFWRPTNWLATQPDPSRKEGKDEEMQKGGHIFSSDVIFVSFY